VGNATIALVGPGGSGKTACCAALLEAYRERSTLAAACATVLPGAARGELEVLLSPAVLERTPVAAPQVVQALGAARDEGLLLLDLPALSPADRGSIRAFAALLGSLRPDRVIVALPATLGPKPAVQLLEALRPLGASALAITHADETDQLGVAVQAACAFGLAPEYLLDRGRGRGGLIQVDPAYLADRLLP
jgi:flagellar biosynthesis GTPase FlhF